MRRRKLPPPAASQVYELTAWGAELEPVVAALGRWGSRSPSKPDGIPLGVDALALALRTMFSPAAAAGLDASYELRLGQDRFRAQVTDGELRLVRGEADGPDATIDTDPATLQDLVFHGRDLTEALRAGDVTIHGDRATVARFLSLFSLPAPA